MNVPTRRFDDTRERGKCVRLTKNRLPLFEKKNIRILLFEDRTCGERGVKKKKEEEAVCKWVYFKGQEETRWAKLLANDVVSSAGVEEGRECVNQQQQHRRWGIMAVR